MIRGPGQVSSHIKRRSSMGRCWNSSNVGFVELWESAIWRGLILHFCIVVEMDNKLLGALLEYIIKNGAGYILQKWYSASSIHIHLRRGFKSETKKSHHIDCVSWICESYLQRQNDWFMPQPYLLTTSTPHDDQAQYNQNHVRYGREQEEGKMKLSNCVWPDLAAGYAFGTNNSRRRNVARTVRVHVTPRLGT